MKKYIIPFLSFALFVPAVLSAGIDNNSGNQLDKNHIQELPAMTITADTDNEITAEYGINILLDPDVWILWHESDIAVSGSAVDNGRIADDVQPVYPNDHKSLYIPVQEDFLAGEELEIILLKVRTYDKDFNRRYFGLDLNGDLIAEVTDLNGYRIENIDDVDNTFPYPVYDLVYTINTSGDVELSWVAPPDYDLAFMRIDKWLITDGVETYKPKIFDDLDTEYTDTDLQGADEVRYKFTTVDLTGKVSPEVEITVDLTAPEEVVTEEVTENEPVPELYDGLADEVAPLYNYYKIRYSIKCNPSGVPVPENDSACLWARIDLVYTQDVTGQSDSDAILTQTDLDRMATRRKWPEMRYEDNCVNTDEPSDNCTSLGKALDRISYFLDL